MKDNLHPELKDILNRIHAYNISHKEGCFVFNFVGWKKDEENICKECGEHCDCVDLDKSLIGVHGDLETLRAMSNELRDLIEDYVDEDGFVSI